MIVEGLVIDELTGNGIPGASVTITDINAKPTGEGTIADNQGIFKYSGSTLDNAGYMLFSSVGYKPALAHYSVILESGFIGLTQDSQQLADVVVTPTKKKNNGALLAAGALLALSYASQPHGRRIGQVETKKTDYSKYILPVGIVAVGYFVIKTVTNTLGLTETADQKAQRQASQDALKKTADSVYATQSPTKTDGEWSAIADIIFNDLRSSSPLLNTNDNADAGYQIARAQNMADVMKLLQYFGSREQSLFGITGPSMTLPEFIRKELATDAIEQVNNNYKSKGITWQW